MKGDIMHDIIKKALDEALTESYNAELMGCAEEEYSFTSGFVADMKALIRKTDNKLIYYSKYIAVAACAVIAIGCAVLLPNLINSGISVESTTETVTIETTTTIDTEITTVPIIADSSESTEETVVTTESTDNTTTPPVTDTSTDTEETIPEEEIVVTPPTDTEETSVSEEAAPTEEEDEVVEEDTTEDSEVPDGDNGSPDTEDGETETGDVMTDDCEDDVAVDDDADEDIGVDSEDDVAEDDVEDSGDADEDVGVDSDDDVAEDDVDDCDSEDDVDDDVVIEDDEDVSNDSEEARVPLEGDTLGETFDFILEKDGLGTKKENLVPSRVVYEQALLGNAFFDYEAITEFINSNLDAPVADNEFVSDEYIVVYLGTGKEVQRKFYDTSPRNKSYFESETEEDVEEDEEDNEYTREISVLIYRNGYIKVYAEMFNSDRRCFMADAEAAEKLFERFSDTYLTKEAKTLGDIIDIENITADNISIGYGKVFDCYDITLTNVPLDTKAEKKFIVDFLEKYRDKQWTEPRAYGKYEDKVSIEIGLLDTYSYLEFKFTTENEMIITDGDTGYVFILPDKEIKNIIAFLCRSAGVAEPVFYGNMAEYLSDKPNSEKINKVQLWINYTDKYIITDEAKLAEIYGMIMAIAETSEYQLYYDTHYYPNEWITVTFGPWYITLKPWVFHIFRSNFSLGDPDIYEKIKAYITENADETNTMNDTGVDDEEVMVDD